MKHACSYRVRRFLLLNSIFGQTNNSLKPLSLMNFEADLLCPTMTFRRKGNTDIFEKYFYH